MINSQRFGSECRVDIVKVDLKGPEKGDEVTYLTKQVVRAIGNNSKSVEIVAYAYVVSKKRGR